MAQHDISKSCSTKGSRTDSLHLTVPFCSALWNGLIRHSIFATTLPHQPYDFPRSHGISKRNSDGFCWKSRIVIADGAFEWLSWSGPHLDVWPQEIAHSPTLTEEIVGRKIWPKAKGEFWSEIQDYLLGNGHFHVAIPPESAITCLTNSSRLFISRWDRKALK